MCSSDLAVEAGVELLAPAIAIGLFEQGMVPVAHGNLLIKYRAHRVIVASGIIEQPLVFPGNDLIGVMLPDAVRRLVNGFSIKPGERAVVLTVERCPRPYRTSAAADCARSACAPPAGRR